MNYLIRTLRRRAAVAVDGFDGDVHATARSLADSARTAGRRHAGTARSTTLPLADSARNAARTLADATRTFAHALPLAPRRSARDLVTLTRAGAFWLGIALPFVHVPLLLAAGLTERTALPLAVLWTLHAFALLVGSRHDPRQS